MAQIGYNTITITDTNDIERIYTVYAKSTSNTDAPSASADSWTESISTAPGSGDYIWQRTVVKKSGTGELTYSTPVCVTGPEGDQGKGVKSLVTQYYLSTASDSVTGGSWSPTPQSYPTTGTKYYWTKTITTYTDNSTYESTPVYNVALTNSVKDARDANTTANEAKGLSEQTHVDVVNLQTRTKYFWTNLVAHTNGTSGWTKPNYPAGTYAASGISGTTFDYENSSTYGYNTLYSNGIKLRYNAINLGELTGSSLTFYNPSTTSQGTKAMELSGSALKFYASNGSTVQAEFGGTKARVSGTIEALDGQIGNNANNYWYIGNYVDYNQNQSAAIKSYGTAFIQLGSSNTWRIATNRFHSAWNDDSSGTSGQLHYPVYDSKYWDSGLHLPTSLTDKFLYIRNAPNTQTLENLQNDLEDSGYDYWTYRFYISADGSLYARNLYVLDDNGNITQIGGTDGVYLLKSGGTITGNLEVNGTLTKGSKNVAYFTTTPTTGQVVVTDGTTGGVKTTGYTIAKSVPSNALFTDANVAQTATTTNSAYELLFSGTADNTTRTEGARKTSTLTYNPSTKALVTGGTVNGYTLAAASAKGVDTSMTASSTSTNLPTTKAVADLIATYLPLAGGTISGAVDINDELYADSATFGNLIVTGAGRFTNGIYGELTGNVTGNLTGNATTATTATKVGNNLIIKLNSGTTEGTNMFTFNGSAAKTVDVTKSAIGLGNVENKSSATIRGELTSANVITALGFTPYDSTNPNGYTSNTGTVTSVRIQATSPVVSSVSTASSTTLNTTISLADGYGDTKNPYASKTANYVLAAPSNATGVPTFRALVAADIPNLGWSKITSGKPTTSSGYGITDAITDIGSNADGQLVLTFSNGTTGTRTVSITATEQSSVAKAEALNTNGALVGNTNKPVYFNTSGKPVAISYEINKTVPSDAKFTDTTYSAGTGLSLTGTTFSNSGVTGIKGNSESSYRTGQVNLTPANIGAATANHTHIPTDIVTPSTFGQNGMNVISGARIGSYMSNKSFALPADAIIIEYSNDAGNTWHDYGATDAQKKDLFTETRATGFYIGKSTTVANKSLNDRLRITISATDRYVEMSMIYLWYSTQGNTSWIDLEYSKFGDPNTFIKVFENQQITGWSGHNLRYFSIPLFGGSSNAGNTSKIRIIFKMTALSESYPAGIINDIRFYGSSVHSSPNNMVLLNHLYKWDRDLNATFPAQITATQFNGPLNGNATSATSSKYLMNRGATTVTIADSSWVPSFTPSGHTMREKVWHQKWTQSGITYTPSGGSATNNTDSADLIYWLSSSNTANTLQVNMAIDGLVYAYGGFKGDLSGNATTATTASKVSGSAGTDSVNRHVWFSHSSTETQRVYDDDFKYNPSTNTLTVGSITGSAGSVAWSGITSNPISFTSTTYGTTGWKQLNGRESNASSIKIWKPTDAVTWGTAAHSAVIAYGVGDTKGMIDISYNSPIVSIAGGNASGSTDAAPKWYFKFSATSGATYTFPTTSKTLAATDGTGASGTWGISISGTAATATNVTGTLSQSPNDGYRHVWFSWRDTETKRAYTETFTYCPADDKLKVGSAQLKDWDISEDTTTKALVFKFVG